MPADSGITTSAASTCCRPPRAAARPGRTPPASAGPGSPRPYPVHAARKEDPAARAARGAGASRQLHRRPAPHPGPALPEGRHGAGNPVRPWRTGHIAARLHPRPLPQGELIRANPDAVAEAVALGTTVATTQPQENVRVLLDPARHPFRPGPDQ